MYEINNLIRKVELNDEWYIYNCESFCEIKLNKAAHNALLSVLNNKDLNKNNQIIEKFLELGIIKK